MHAVAYAFAAVCALLFVPTTFAQPGMGGPPPPRGFAPPMSPGGGFAVQQLPFDTATIACKIESENLGDLRQAVSVSGANILNGLLEASTADVERAVREITHTPLDKVTIVVGQPGFQPKQSPADKEMIVSLLAWGGGYGGAAGSSGSEEFTLGLNSWPETSSDAATRVLQAIATLAAEKFPEYSRKHLADLLGSRQKQADGGLKAANDRVSGALSTLSSSNGLPPEKIADQLAEVDRQLLATRLSFEVRNAREAAIQKALADIAANLDSRSADNRMLQNLQKIVELRKQQFEINKAADQKVPGSVGSGALAKAEEEMLAAIVDLDRTEAEFKRGEGGDQLAALNRELVQVSIDKAEDQARLKFLDEARQRVHRELLQRQQADARVREAMEELGKAQKEVDHIERAIKLIKSAQDNLAPLKLTVQQ